MKNVNILSIIEAYRKLSNTLFQKLMNSYGIISGIKDYELNGIESFVNELLKIKNSITIVNNYYLGYSIPQIGKEFDLLRFGDNYIINIEIKTESSIDKIFKQQQKNKYYLEFLNKEIYIYTYILNENKLYKLIRKDSNHLYRVPEHLREHHQEYKQKDSYAKIPYTCPHLFLRIASRI